MLFLLGKTKVKIKMNTKVLAIFLLVVSTLYSEVIKKKLNDSSFNHYSQFGEDSIIEKIFEIIGTQSKFCIEFGAADGLECSNTAYLWKHKNWKSILIEPDESKYQKLMKNISGYNCIPINMSVGCDANNSLDFIIKQKLKIEDTVDLLSIDIDGNDYYIFESLEALHPRVIICEYNPTIPVSFDIYQAYTDKFYQFGCSVKALMRIAQEKGYKLIALTEANAIFVEEKEIPKFSDYEIDCEKIKIEDHIKYLITCYSGEPIIVGNKKEFPWGLVKHGCSKKIITNEKLITIKNLEIQ